MPLIQVADCVFELDDFIAIEDTESGEKCCIWLKDGVRMYVHGSLINVANCINQLIKDDLKSRETRKG